MARVLHLLPHGARPLAADTIRRDVEAGDDVAVALLTGASGASGLPPGVGVHRVPEEWSYDDLLERIFAADRVVTW